MGFYPNLSNLKHLHLFPKMLVQRKLRFFVNMRVNNKWDWIFREFAKKFFLVFNFTLKHWTSDLKDGMIWKVHQENFYIIFATTCIKYRARLHCRTRKISNFSFFRSDFFSCGSGMVRIWQFYSKFAIRNCQENCKISLFLTCDRCNDAAAYNVILKMTTNALAQAV